MGNKMKSQEMDRIALERFRSNLQKELAELQERARIKVLEVEELKTSLQNLKNGNLYLCQILQSLKTPEQEKTTSQEKEWKTGSLVTDLPSSPELLQDRTECKSNNRNEVINTEKNDLRLADEMESRKTDEYHLEDGQDSYNLNKESTKLPCNSTKSTLPTAPDGFKVLRQLNSRSLLVSWNPPSGPGASGYEIYVNGYLHSEIRSGSRTKALLQNLNLKRKINISLYALSTCGQSPQPARIEYSGEASFDTIPYLPVKQRTMEGDVLSSGHPSKYVETFPFTLPYTGTHCCFTQSKYSDLTNYMAPFPQYTLHESLGYPVSWNIAVSMSSYPVSYPDMFMHHWNNTQFFQESTETGIKKHESNIEVGKDDKSEQPQSYFLKEKIEDLNSKILMEKFKSTVNQNIADKIQIRDNEHLSQEQIKADTQGIQVHDVSPLPSYPCFQSVYLQKESKTAIHTIGESIIPPLEKHMFEVVDNKASCKSNQQTSRNSDKKGQSKLNKIKDAVHKLYLKIIQNEKSSSVLLDGEENTPKFKSLSPTMSIFVKDEQCTNNSEEIDESPTYLRKFISFLKFPTENQDREMNQTVLLKEHFMSEKQEFADKDKNDYDPYDKHLNRLPELRLSNTSPNRNEILTEISDTESSNFNKPEEGSGTIYHMLKAELFEQLSPKKDFVAPNTDSSEEFYSCFEESSSDYSYSTDSSRDDKKYYISKQRSDLSSKKNNSLSDTGVQKDEKNFISIPYPVLDAKLLKHYIVNIFKGNSHTPEELQKISVSQHNINSQPDKTYNHQNNEIKTFWIAPSSAYPHSEASSVISLPEEEEGKEEKEKDQLEFDMDDEICIPSNDMMFSESNLHITGKINTQESNTPLESSPDCIYPKGIKSNLSENAAHSKECIMKEYQLITRIKDTCFHYSLDALSDGIS